MERSTRVFSTVVVLLLLLATIEMGPITAEARTCEYLSDNFKGPCILSGNCNTICEGEGFVGGQCGGFRRRCFCVKYC